MKTRTLLIFMIFLSGLLMGVCYDTYYYKQDFARKSKLIEQDLLNRCQSHLLADKQTTPFNDRDMGYVNGLCSCLVGKYKTEGLLKIDQALSKSFQQKIYGKISNYQNSQKGINDQKQCIYQAIEIIKNS